MAFFDKGKGKDNDKPAAEKTGGKESFSLFKKPPQSGGQEAAPAGENSRFLTLIRGQGALAAPASDTPPAAEPPAAEPAAPSAPAAQAPKLAAPEPTSKPVGLSLKRKAPVVQSPPPEPRAGAADAPAVTPPIGKGPEAAAAVRLPVPQAPTQPTTRELEPTPKKARGLGRLFTKKTPAAPKEEKPKKAPPAKKPRVSGRASLGASKDFHLYVQLENGKEFFWAVTANHVQEVDRKKVTRAASFCREDTALRAPKGLSFKGAENLALQEIGEPVHIVNRSRDLSSVYATSEDRALSSSFRIFPGQQAVDKLVKDAKAAGKHTIAGFTFNTQDGKTALCVLFYINPEGLSTKPQITLNPDNMEFVLQQFATSRKINKKEAEILLFNNADFLGQVGGLLAYPEERVWRGFPVSSLVRASAFAAVLGSGAMAGWAGLNYTQVAQLKHAIATLDTRVDQHRKQSSTLIADSLYSFASAMSLDQARALTLAQQVWQPGSRLTMLADLNQVKYNLKIPVVLNKRFNNRPSVDSTPMPAEVQQAMNFEPPAGCTKDNTSVSGNLNEIQVTVVCTSPDSALSGFRND